MNFFKNKSIFITGGTGSIGMALVEQLLKEDQVKRITVFSRDEMKQWEMEHQFPASRLFFRLGDIRDEERILECLKGHEIVIHTAALKQVPRGEDNPGEFIKTNVLGTKNLISAAGKANVERFLFISSDKAVSPSSNYGSSKLSGERMVINAALETTDTIYTIVRFGNVLGSRGTVLPYFLSLKESGYFPVTDPENTRFHLTKEQAAQAIFYILQHARGGDIFIPKVRSFRLKDLVSLLDPTAVTRVIGLRKGEKRHEILFTEQESRHVIELESFYVLLPELSETRRHEYLSYYQQPFIKEPFEYSSAMENCLMDQHQLRNEIEHYLAEVSISQKTITGRPVPPP